MLKNSEKTQTGDSRKRMNKTKKKRTGKIANLKIKPCKKVKSKNKSHHLIKNKFILPVALLVIILAMLVLLRPVLIGYFAFEEAEEHIKEVDKLFVENSSYLFSLEEGELKSLKISGSVIGDGNARIYLEAGN
ncbi:hypothetical protein COY26_03965, partial [Candidatus Woesearchaeota archaeon CG_4_10_14_0_2_um_filter_33_10]